MSKHITYMTIALFLLSTLTLWAQFQKSGKSGITTVSAAQEAGDDLKVSLTGIILRQIGEEQYLFQDSTGTMIIEIDHEDWPQDMADPETILRISGEIEREWWRTAVEVERVEVEPTLSQSISQNSWDQVDITDTIDVVKFSGRNLSQFQLH